MQTIDYSIDQLIEWLTGDDSSLRREASNALTAIGEKAVIPLITALNNSDNMMLDEIAQVLSSIGDKRAVEPLIKALYQCDQRIRWR
jgi:HEAT repeat protein